MIGDQRGQSLIEAVFSTGILISLISTLLFLLYYAFSFHFLRMELQEALLCLHNTKATSTCQRKLIDQLEEILPIGTVDKVLLERRRDRLSGLVVFRIDADLTVEDLQELSLPLIPPGTPL